MLNRLYMSEITPTNGQEGFEKSSFSIEGLTSEQQKAAADVAETMRQRANESLTRILNEHPELQKALVDVTDMARQEATTFLSLTDEWQNKGPIGKLRLTPGIIKAGFMTAFGTAMVDTISGELQRDAQNTVRQESTWSPKQRKEFLKGIVAQGLLKSST